MKRKKWLAGIIGIAISASVIFAPVATVQAEIEEKDPDFKWE